MSAWPDKYVIGLTGNIATGKSLVREMLEHLGALGIDADVLAHQAISNGYAGYQAVVKEFGQGVLAEDGHINRTKLGSIVFSDPKALKRLEAIVHPLVGLKINELIQSTSKDICVIEAIKLIEAGLHKQCDALWVTRASRDNQITRLIDQRQMTREGAIIRIDAQPPQGEKVALADVVIENNQSIEGTWKQVIATWNKTTPGYVKDTGLPAFIADG